MTAPLACPFPSCGSDKVGLECSGSQWYVVCHQCNCNGPSITDGEKDDSDRAVQAWNAVPRQSAPELAAVALIDKWVEVNRRPIPWATAVKITAILTKMPDEERDRLLALG